MPLSSERLPKVLGTALNLPFLEQDLQRYPWLHLPARYYYVGEKIGEGVYGTAYRSYACDQFGVRFPEREPTELVVKIPKIQRVYLTADGLEERTAIDEDIRERLTRVRDKNIQDFFHIRMRLLGCLYANPCIDLAHATAESKFELHVAVQPFLSHAQALDDWLLLKGIRQQPVSRQGNRKLVDNWYGIHDRVTWIEIALQLARAIEDIHLRRVTHADLHPGNVFLSLDEPTIVTLIDFGEAFLSTPDRNSRPRNPSPYLAPERVGPRFVLSESVDVYSFGVLLLYLATGSEPEIREPKAGAAVPSGWKRRLVYEAIRSRNPGLLGTDEPRILDVIGRSIATDPADRPRMTDICADLEGIKRSWAPALRDRERSIGMTLKEIAEELHDVADHHHPLLLQLLEREIRRLATTFRGLTTEMVELSGTRDQLIRSLVSVFDYLQAGDSWTAATTLAMWQRNALGLDGSYASANIRALKRGVAVRRIFLISVEELGQDFCDELVNQLGRESEPALRRLRDLFLVAINEFMTVSRRANYPRVEPEVINWHRDRFEYLLDFTQRLVEDWKVPLCRDNRIDIERSHGLYFGICPVSTLDRVGEKREDNPVSLMHCASQEGKRRWLLVATEAQGRKENPKTVDEPRLLGMRVYQSVQSEEGVPGIPVDRKAWLQKLIHDDSVGAGPVAARLLHIVRTTREALRKTD
jgi:hypothetical protein